MSVVCTREAARRDLIEHFVYLPENASVDMADRFLLCAESCFGERARQPMMESPLNLKHSDLVNVRKWQIKGFDNHLVFYEPRSDGVSIVRLLHAMRDWWSLLGLSS